MGNVCRSRFAWLVLPIILLPLCLGCGDGRETRVPVSGMVTVDGEPLKYGSITFMPVKTPGAASRPGGGSLEDGRFSVSSYTANDGLLKGKYEAMVNAIEPIGDTAQRWHAPKKYANMKTSGLTVDVSGPIEDLKFDLSWEGEKHSKPFVEKF